MKHLSDITHPELVAALVKPGQDILDSLTPLKCHLWHMASCIPGEAGELFDAIKKLTIYGKILDRQNVIEELGDLEFYMQGLRDALNITREETLAANIAKLSKRYVGLTYSDKSAQERADKYRDLGFDEPFQAGDEFFYSDPKWGPNPNTWIPLVPAHILVGKTLSQYGNKEQNFQFRTLRPAQERADKLEVHIDHAFPGADHTPQPFVHPPSCPAASGEPVCTCPPRRFS